MQVLYEDNHIIIVAKRSGEIVQGDKTGDRTLADDVKAYIKEKYQKPGEVFLGVVHRLDRPVAGVVVFARTSKALARLNRMFRDGEIHKTYWAIVANSPVTLSATRKESKDTAPEGFVMLENWIARNEKQNKSYAYDREVPNSKLARMRYRVAATGDRYSLLEVELMTGRHHQIRCQLAHAGMAIKGDLKYGAPRSNADGSIALLARKIEFLHPVSKRAISVIAPTPTDSLWQALSSNIGAGTQEAEAYIFRKKQ